MNAMKSMNSTGSAPYINSLSEDQAREELQRCCGAARWVEGMLHARPFDDAEQLTKTAKTLWYALQPEDWKEAFLHHPKIGDISSLREKFANTTAWASGEQSGVQDATETTLTELADGNERYEARFGYIFIVCATGKSAAEMLALLNDRLKNDAETELHVAAAEQHNITLLRLQKLGK